MPDEIRRPANEVELRQQLADTIGASVEQLLGNTGFSEVNNALIDPRLLGQPAQAAGGEERPAAPGPNGLPVPPAQAAPASPAKPSAAPAIDFERYKDPATGKYARKYDSVEQFANGLGHAMDMTYQTQNENDRLRKQIEDLTSELTRRTPVVPQTTIPPDTSSLSPSLGDDTKLSPKLAEALASMSEGNAPTPEDLLKLANAISEHSAQVARKAAREAEEERVKIAEATKDRWDKVDEYIGQKYPQAMNFTREMSLFQKTNPVIGQVVSALIKEDLHEKAMEILWKEFATAHGIPVESAVVPTKEIVEKEIRLDAADQVRREAMEQARKDAGVIPSMPGSVHGVHENQNAGPSQEEINEAVRLMNMGHGERWRSIVFKDTLNHPLFDALS